jgi:hypothetical protein
VLGAWLVLGASTSAQSGGETVFRIFSRGREIGAQTVTLERTDSGWHVTSSGEMKEPFQLQLKQFDILYDASWRPRIMTMEIASVDDRAVVHVAFGLSDGSTRTDVVRDGTAQWGANKVSPDTIPMPDFVFGAFEALAARLATASPGTELRAFVVPRLDGVTDDMMPTTAGTLDTKRWRMRLARPEGDSPLEAWIAGGRLVRLDLARDGMSVVRSDVIWGR